MTGGRNANGKLETLPLSSTGAAKNTQLKLLVVAFRPFLDVFLYVLYMLAHIIRRLIEHSSLTGCLWKMINVYWYCCSALKVVFSFYVNLIVLRCTGAEQKIKIFRSSVAHAQWQVFCLHNTVLATVDTWGLRDTSGLNSSLSYLFG